MKILKIVLIVLALAAAGILAAAATRPDVFRVERAATIQAPPERIAAVLSDFHAWKAWSPWERMDPQMKRTYGGAEKGKGATYAWQGEQVGEGRMQITEATAQRVALDLDFFKPFPARNKVEFALQPKQGGTEVRWSMVGGVPFLAKIVHVFVDMDKMVGGQMEAGLANLKSVTEK